MLINSRPRTKAETLAPRCGRDPPHFGNHLSQNGGAGAEGRFSFCWVGLPTVCMRNPMRELGAMSMLGKQQQQKHERSANDACGKLDYPARSPSFFGIEGLVVTRHNRVSFAPPLHRLLLRRWTIRGRWVAVVLPRMHGTQRDAADVFVLSL